MWHARVAQALSSHEHYEDAVDHYLLSLANGVKPSWVAHAGAASAFSKLGKHKEALDHNKRSNYARELEETSVKTSLQEVESALDTALIEDAAGLSQQAVQSARRAWFMYEKANENYEKADEGYQISNSFLEIFSRNGKREETMQVIQHVSKTSTSSGKTWTAEVLPEVLYSAFCLCTEFEVKAMEIYDQLLAAVWDQQAARFAIEPHFMIAGQLYRSGLFFLRNWQTNKAIKAWELLLSPQPLDVKPDLEFLMELRSRIRARLVTLYLKSLRTNELEGSGLMKSLHRLFDTGGSGPRKDDILQLIEEPVDSDVNLVMANWCHLHGNGNKARDLLRGRVQKCVELLSDDDPSNDIDAYVMLFTTCLAMRDIDADVAGALYLMKAWKYQPDSNPSGAQHERTGRNEQRDEGPITELMADNNGADTAGEEPSIDDISYKLTSLPQPQPAPITDPTKPSIPAIDLPDVDFQSPDITAECENCQIQRHTWSGWYFCRFCPMVQLCAGCFNLLRSGDWKNQICDSDHEFFFTGDPLCVEEMVPNGKVPVGDKVIWIEEWKDRLKEEWRTDEFGEDEHRALVREVVQEISTVQSSVDATSSPNDNDT